MGDAIPTARHTHAIPGLAPGYSCSGAGIAGRAAARGLTHVAPRQIVAALTYLSSFVVRLWRAVAAAVQMYVT